MYQGIVKWFNNKKGFGFITKEDGEDIFVHYTAICDNGYRSLARGEHVTFEIAEGEHGPQAYQVTKNK